LANDMAEAAATRDPRFPPLTAGDLAALQIEMSVLSEPHRMVAPAELEIGRHGIEIRSGGAHGLLLPQVAVEHGLTRERFLDETCRKAGLPRGAWRDPATEVYLFEAEVFSERPHRPEAPPQGRHPAAET
jgi:AmmeMemoRadiSam system protein A